jgi:DNA-binding NtrC family response regulator
MNTYEILVVGLANEERTHIESLLKGAGYSSLARDSIAGIQTLILDGLECVVLCADLGIETQLRLASEIHRMATRVQIIVCASHAHLGDLIKLSQEKLFWVLAPNWLAEDLLNLTARASVLYHLATVGSGRQKQIVGTAYKNFIAGSPSMQRLFMRLEKIASLDATVLLLGESGTGKTAIASLIHAMSKRNAKPFLAINCAALPKDLLESELFGHEKGAFTGASASKVGIFEQCDGGTVLLDELGELPLELQPKLLSFLQDKVVRRVGGRTTKQVDVRIITATNTNLAGAVSLGKFRGDLFYRVNVLSLEIPALRDRVDDILPIADYHLQKIAPHQNVVISAEAAQSLKAYPWPGNVRELEHVLERAVAFADSATIAVKDLELPQFEATVANPERASLAGRTLKDVEEQLFRETLDLCSGDKVRAAAMLGVSLRTVYNVLKRSGNSHPQSAES